MKPEDKVSLEGQRIGYLYDRVSPDDKKAIDDILSKYEDLFPLIYILGRRDKALMSPAEARETRALFARAKQAREAKK